MIVLVDYRTANLGSVVNMFRHIGTPCRVAGVPSELAGATGILLPGIGKFDTCSANLRTLGFADGVQAAVAAGVPLLGICVGAQLLTRGSEEGSEPGLGLIPAQTRLIVNERATPGLRVPHMGWNTAHLSGPHPLFEGYEADPRFYFLHSYAIHCDDPADRLASTVHGVAFASAIGRGRVFGVQFHPEKSHRFGMRLLANFSRICAGVDGAA